jgi:hypothetical protein
MLNMRQVARAAFRFASAIEPVTTNGPSRPRSLLDPRHLARAGFLTARFGSELMDRLFKGPEAAIGYVELDNKVRAFQLFEAEVAHLDSQAATLAPAEGIRSAQSRLGEEQAVWATEGIGYELFERCRRAGRPARDLFGGPGDGVPDGSWTVLHTGMGMALAESRLERIPSRPAPGSFRETLVEHVKVCQDAARASYAELAFEPLGLVTRLLRPDLVQALGPELDRIGSPWSDLFWHGVGRGLYFLPANLAPGRSAPWTGLSMCRAEPPGESSRRNASAGFAWAVTLVNLRRPEVVESFLSHHLQGRDPADPVAQGILSALLLWHETTRGSRELRHFIAHVALPERRSLWARFVRDPFEEAARRWASSSPRDDGRRVGELFRYR